MKRSKIKIINKEELTLLKTKQLLSRLKSLQQCEKSYFDTDLTSCGISNPDNYESEFIIYKDTEKWLKAYNEVRDELNKREHIPKRKELEKIKLIKFLNNKTKAKERPKKLK